MCEACNEPGSVGTCVTVAGKPRSKRTCSGTGACAEAICDGFTATSCGKFAHAFETKCAESSCKGALFTSSGYCDGRGTCAVPTTASCAPYACDPNGCLTSCSTAASCAEGFLCKDGKCVAPDGSATCVDDGLSSKSGTDGTTKPCAPYRCAPTGLCGGKCDTSLECAPGFSCDEAHTGVATGGGGDGGGCAMSDPAAPRSDGGSLLAVLAGLCVIGVARRPRSRGRSR